MSQLINNLWNDEAGFIVSAELVLIATIAVLSMIVGLSEVAYGVNQELEDVGAAIGAINQTYSMNGTAGTKARLSGSFNNDQIDQCDSQNDITCNVAPTQEADITGHHHN